MNEQEKAKKLQEVFADKAFAEKVFGLETAEEVQGTLAEKGVELSVQEINDIRDALVKQMESGEEFDAKELKTVAGGLGSLSGCCIGPHGILGTTVSHVPQISLTAIGNRW